MSWIAAVYATIDLRELPLKVGDIEMWVREGRLRTQSESREAISPTVTVLLVYADGATPRHALERLHAKVRHYKEALRPTVEAYMTEHYNYRFTKAEEASP